MPGLATDLDNRDFVGAMNPDSLLNVRFFEEAIPNEYASKEQNRPIFDNVIKIEICIPGPIPNLVHRYALEKDKIRWPQAWAHFEKTGKSGERFVSGTPVQQWAFLNPAQVEMLKAVKFYSVESIANANDLQLQAIGMHMGFSATDLQAKARAFLNSAANASAAEQAQSEIKARDDKIAELERQRQEDKAEMLANMEALRQQLASGKPAAKPKKVLTPEHKAKLAAGRARARAAA